MNRIALSAAAVCIVCAAPAGMTRPAATSTYSASLQLTQVKEVRQTSLTGDSSSTPSFDRPGLTLTFALDLPAGATLVELREPTALRAVDSTGLDLADVKPRWGSEPDYIDVVHAWEGQPREATLTLALPRRQAQSISVQARLEAVVCSGTQKVDAGAAGTAAPLRTGIPGFPEATMRVDRKNGQLQVIVSPGTVKPWIEDVAVVAGGATLDSNSAMWSDAQVVYFVDAPAGVEPQKVQLTVRRDLRTIPVKLDLPEVALP
jgi:hypothetical protein